jgi:hypothetical protein
VKFKYTNRKASWIHSYLVNKKYMISILTFLASYTTSILQVYKVFLGLFVFFNPRRFFFNESGSVTPSQISRKMSKNDSLMRKSQKHSINVQIWLWCIKWCFSKNSFFLQPDFWYSYAVSSFFLYNLIAFMFFFLSNNFCLPISIFFLMNAKL